MSSRQARGTTRPKRRNLKSKTPNDAPFSATEQAILQALALFQYLTATQLMKLGITKTRKGVYPTLARLMAEHKPTIARINYTVSPVYGRPESVHYLTPQGVKILQEMGVDAGEIKHPRRTAVTFASDHSHRISTINFSSR